MATVMLMHWRGVTPQQYEETRQKVHWDSDHPSGAKLHISGFSDDGLHVLDVWDSAESFNTFFETRLGPGVQEVGIEGQPVVQFFPLTGVFAPALGLNEQRSDL